MQSHSETTISITNKLFRFFEFFINSGFLCLSRDASFLLVVGDDLSKLVDEVELKKNQKQTNLKKSIISINFHHLIWSWTKSYSKPRVELEKVKQIWKKSSISTFLTLVLVRWQALRTSLLTKLDFVSQPPSKYTFPLAGLQQVQQCQVGSIRICLHF